MTLAGSMALPAPRAVLFDWDNTLIDNWLCIQSGYNAALADAGRAPFDLDQVKFQARHSSRDVFPRLFGENFARARDIFYATVARDHLSGLRVMPGAEALMDVLSRAGVPLAVISNKKGDFLRREVAHLGWDARFRTLVGAQDARADKPDPAPIRLALDRLGISAGADVWMVGDTDIDMRAGAAAGCAGVLIGPGPGDPNLLIGVEPMLRCRDCSELAGLFQAETRTICLQSQG
jgi:phosphoglycolate phosphatase